MPNSFLVAIQVCQPCFGLMTALLASSAANSSYTTNKFENMKGRELSDVITKYTALVRIQINK